MEATSVQALYAGSEAGPLSAIEHIKSMLSFSLSISLSLCALFVVILLSRSAYKSGSPKV